MMRPRTVQDRLPRCLAAPNEALVHCAWFSLSHVAVTLLRSPDVNGSTVVVVGRPAGWRGIASDL